MAVLMAGTDTRALLDLAVKMHDAEIQALLAPGTTAESNRFEILDRRGTLTDLLEQLARSGERSVALLCGFVLDNYVQKAVFDPAGGDESSAQDGASVLELRQRKNALARELGVDCYMDVYLRTRQYDRVETLRYAEDVLNRTRGTYVDAFADLRYADGIGRASFDRSYRRFLHSNVENFGFRRLFPGLREHLTKTFAGRFDGQLEFRAVDQEIVTSAATELRTQRSFILSSRISGYEQFKAGFHGLGHSLFGLLNEHEPYWALPSDIALTESLAFLFQAIPSAEWWLDGRIEVSSTFSARARFYELYFERMYAAETLFEDWYYRTEPSLAAARRKFRAMRREHLSLTEPSDVPLGVEYRPLCVEFLYAFAVLRGLERTLADDPAGWWNGSAARLLRDVFRQGNATPPAHVAARLAGGKNSKS